MTLATRSSCPSAMTIRLRFPWEVRFGFTHWQTPSTRAALFLFWTGQSRWGVSAWIRRLSPFWSAWLIRKSRRRTAGTEFDWRGTVATILFARRGARGRREPGRSSKDKGHSYSGSIPAPKAPSANSSGIVGNTDLKLACLILSRKGFGVDGNGCGHWICEFGGGAAQQPGRTRTCTATKSSPPPTPVHAQQGTPATIHSVNLSTRQPGSSARSPPTTKFPTPAAESKPTTSGLGAPRRSTNTSEIYRHRGNGCSSIHCDTRAVPASRSGPRRQCQ